MKKLLVALLILCSAYGSFAQVTPVSPTQPDKTPKISIIMLLTTSSGKTIAIDSDDSTLSKSTLGSDSIVSVRTIKPGMIDVEITKLVLVIAPKTGDGIAVPSGNNFTTKFPLDFNKYALNLKEGDRLLFVDVEYKEGLHSRKQSPFVLKIIP